MKYGYNQLASAVNAPHNYSFTGIATEEQGNTMPVPRGRVVGGSSAINGQVLLRGVPEDYDNWASWGNDEWSFVKTLPYFRKLETDTDIHDDFHGFDGPIPVRRHKEETWLPAQVAFHQACRDEGYPHDPDMNNPDSWGVGPIPMNNPDGIRMSTSLTYLNPGAAPPEPDRPLQRNGPPAYLRRQPGCGRGRGERRRDGLSLKGTSSSAAEGPWVRPSCLLLSGVGPAGHLQEMGVAVHHELPGVGQNLRDHPNVRIPIRVKEDFPLDPEAPRTQLALRYTAEGSDDRNDMQILQSSFSSPMGGDPLEGEGIRFTCIIELAVGAGELKLASTDPYEQPVLDYNYLEEEWDRERLREGVRLCLKLLESDSYQDIVEECISPTEEDLVSNDTLDMWLRRNVTTTQHISGTCKMGPSTDGMAVVDQYCRVYAAWRACGWWTYRSCPTASAPIPTPPR